MNDESVSAPTTGANFGSLDEFREEKNDQSSPFEDSPHPVRSRTSSRSTPTGSYLTGSPVWESDSPASPSEEASLLDDSDEDHALEFEDSERDEDEDLGGQNEILADGVELEGAAFDEMVASALEDAAQELEGEDEFDDEEYDPESDFDDEEFDFELQDSEDLPRVVSDVADLIESGETEQALRRLGEYGRGVEKLQGQVNQAHQNVDDVRSLLGAIGEGHADAVQTMDALLASYGTSIEGLFAAKTGLNPSGSNSDPRIAWLANRVQAMEAQQANQSWAETHGVRLSKYLENSTGLQISPTVLAKARTHLPAQATAEDIEDAIMRVDPRAYRAALRAAEGHSPAPNSAMISRGGKGSAKIDPSALLNDPRKFEAYIKG